MATPVAKGQTTMLSFLTGMVPNSKKRGRDTTGKFPCIFCDKACDSRAALIQLLQFYVAFNRKLYL